MAWLSGWEVWSERGAMECRSSWSGRCLAGCAAGRSSTVEISAAAPAVRLGSELALQLHQAPDPGAVGAEVGLDVGGRGTDGGQVEAEQLRALLQRCRDRPAHIQVVPGPHRDRISNTCSRPNRESCLSRPDGSLGHIGATNHRIADNNATTSHGAGVAGSRQRPKVPTRRPRAVAAVSMAAMAASGLASPATSARRWRA